MEILAVLLLGSNTGDRSLHLQKALVGVAGLGRIDQVSAVYESTAWGLTEQNDFLNMVAGLYTRLAPEGLLDALLELENNLGRVRNMKWGPRIIDLDILYYGQEIIDKPGLQLPHPGIPDRRFTLVPLASIYPELKHPKLLQNTNELLEQCADSGNVYFYALHP
jgi:2-amino-4-hydroxy-6-hydroxymethyldihydropteridine diphosphokinase